MKRTIWISALSGIALSACASSEPVIGPTGDAAYAIDCSGPTTWDTCYKEAARLCGARGYTIEDKNSDQVIQTAGLEKGAPTYTITQRSMLITCKSDSSSY